MNYKKLFQLLIDKGVTNAELMRAGTIFNLPEDIPAAHLTTEQGQPLNSLGEVVNHAMELVESQSEQLSGVLPKDYTIFSDELLAELLRIFNNNALTA